MASKNYSHGKRMVREDLIAQIGQGGGAEYTAGTGITITDDTISVDTETVAVKTDLTNFVEWYDVNDGDTLTSTQITEIRNGLKRLRHRGWLFELTHDETESSQTLYLQGVTLNGLTDYLSPGAVCSYFISVSTDTGYVSVNDSVVVKANPSSTSGTINDIQIGSSSYAIKPQLQDNSLTLTHGSDEHKKAQITTMTGSTSGTQQTGIRLVGTSNNTSSGTPLDTNMVDIRPGKMSVKVAAVEFANSVSTIDVDSNTTVKIGTNKVLTEADVVANPSTTTDTLTGLTVGGVSYAVGGGGGSSYTFTDGLTETSGTVSWDLNDNFNYGVSGRSLVSLDAQSFDGNNMAQSSIAYMPTNQFSAISNNRYNSDFVGFGIGLATHDVGSPQTNHFHRIMLVGTGLHADYDANNEDQIILGFYNVRDITKAFIIGNGSYSNPNNLMTIDRSGNIECNNIPAAPTTQGTYKLTCTVDAQGNPTFSWEQ